MAAFFDSWRPRQSEAALQSNWEQYCPYPPQSLPVLLPSAQDDASKQAALPLFGAASASTAGSGWGSDDSASSSGGCSDLSSVGARDVVLNAGGPVWGLDWCPAGMGSSSSGSASGEAAAGAAAAESYLAVACHPPDAAHHVIGTAVQGPACIQIWAVSNPAQPQQPDEQQQQQQQQQQDRLAPPRMALALAHDGGLTWHCQWCPDAALADSPASSSSDGGALPRLGLLAAALGDGSLRVWAVPHPAAAARLRPHGKGRGRAASEANAGPLVLSLPPVAAVSSAALGGSMPSVVDWLPSAPHDLLAVGCWDGSVAVLKLAPGQQRHQGSGSSNGRGNNSGDGSSSQMFGLELLCHFSADVLPLRALRWLPPGPPSSGTIDLLHRHILMTGGNEGVLRLWDLRDPFQPMYSHVLSSNSIILSAAFTSQPFGMLTAMDDASLRGVVLDSDLVEAGVSGSEKKAMFSVTWRGTDMGAIWSLAVQPAMQFVAYGGEDGVVGVFRADYEAVGRRRQHHMPVAGWRLEGAALALKSPQQLSGYRGLFAGKVEERKERLKGARLPEEAEAVHRVAWSLHASGGAAWLASAGAAGLVRCQWIASQ